jgi:hypothetical protein
MRALAGTGWFLIFLGIVCIFTIWHTYVVCQHMTALGLDTAKKQSPNLFYGMIWSLNDIYKMSFQIGTIVSIFSICFGAYILDLRKKLLRLIREEAN